ncbi:GNAT family N-acetyltransferase [Allonocardiopsis opalescens]|uniref:Acetyltransferase (GNAT) family protein n=1 Tax=Allonocardiopsis opalescens TaxID=1144618 RepID=A0A2T0PXP7_9ACTN|nr:GNAT family N-acetyltransferase [Allonocardiopsis opalescens]PRX96315.1 acetyltransferase (GNAT) family protein [Allonocardiopsis opalescens]
MSLWRLRVHVEDRPGQLARLSEAVAAAEGNILGMSVQVDADGVVDEILVSTPHGQEELVDAVRAAPDDWSAVAVSAGLGELVDEPTRALLLAARVRSAPATLPDVLAELLHADEASWTQPDEVSVSAAGAAKEADRTVLVVPVGHLRAVRLRRLGLPFTFTEAARADALVRSILPPTTSSLSERQLKLNRSTNLVVRQVDVTDLAEVQELHQRCAADGRTLPGFAALERLSPRLLEVLCDRSRGTSLAVWSADESVLIGLAHLMYTSDSGIGEVAVMMEERWRRLGVATRLVQLALEIARSWGLAEVRMTVAADDRETQRAAARMGGTVTELPDLALEVRFPVTGTADTPSVTDLRQMV